MTFLIRAPEETIGKYRQSGLWRTESVVDDVMRWAAETPNAQAVVTHRDGGGLTRLTYGELAGWVDRFAGALAELGIGPADVVSMQLPNWWQSVALALACSRAGAVSASIMPTIRGRELERMLARLQARVFITTDRWDDYEHAATVAEMAPRLPALRHRVVLGDVVRDEEIDFVQFFQQRDRPALSEPATDPDAVALALFTSGTTGEPKAALHTLNDQYAQVLSLQPGPGDGSKIYLHTTQSVMHAAGLLSVNWALISGGWLLLTDRWVPERTAHLVAEERVEHLTLVPPLLTELLAALRGESIRLPALRGVTGVGTSISPELVAETAEVLGLSLRSGWGMTEGGMIGTSPQDPPDWSTRSIGRAGRGTETELRSLNPDEPISERNPGRLMIRGSSVCLATMGRDSGTLHILADHDDGWYDTGDLAVPDGRDGYRLIGRAADRIGGASMIPVTDVEDTLRAHPDIVDVAIVGHRGDSEGCAVLVSTVPVSLEDVRSYLAGVGMTEWYWPTKVERVNALPRNAMGKVEKARLRAWLAGRAELPANP